MKKILFCFSVLVFVAIFAACQIGNFGAVLSGNSTFNSYTVVQVYETNTNTNHGSDDAAGFFSPGRPSGKFFPTNAATQGAHNVAVIGFGAQAAGITTSQTISAVSDSSGSVWTHCTPCTSFFGGVAKVQDAWYTLNTAGLGSVPEIDFTLANPISGGERIGIFYAEGAPSPGRGDVDTIGQILDSVACGNPTPCSGVTNALLSPPMIGTTDLCVQWIIAGAGQSSANSPWASNYTNNGDHSAQATAIGLNNTFTTPAFTSSATANGVSTAICFD